MPIRRAALLTLLPLAAAGVVANGGGRTAAHVAAQDTTRAFPARWEFPRGGITPVRAAQGMVVTTDRVASEIGAEILRRGGNAVDAAVATHFALAVVNPEAGNIGGGGFMVVRMANGTVASLDFREAAPMRATRDMFLDSAGNVTDRSVEGHLAAGVPGSVAGMWEAHRRFGKLPWAELVQPAVHLAEGIVVHERLALSLTAYQERLGRYPATARIFTPGGKAPRVGDRLVQADLAETLRRVARDGMAGFYTGRTAELVEAEMQRGGGLISRADMARYKAAWRDPIRFRYRGHEVISMPPPSSGGATMAEILKIMEGYDLRRMRFMGPEHVHLFAEAARRPTRTATRTSPIPTSSRSPGARMISDAYAASAAPPSAATRATASAEVAPGLGAPPPRGRDTRTTPIMDQRGTRWRSPPRSTRCTATW
jgi:gamma-glutamyltranspeptidase/glutathione hydrolase